MRLARILVFVCLACAAGPAQTPRAVEEAEREVQRLTELVEAGVAPRKQLEEAQNRLAEAQDLRVLESTLYGKIEITELDESQSVEMVAAAERRLALSKNRLTEANKLVDAGAMPRMNVTPLLEEMDRRRRTLDEAVSRANLIKELAEMARREVEIEERFEQMPEFGPRPLAERFDGTGVFHDGHWRITMVAYETEFGKPMPVSARGATAFHRALGYDHRGRVDVALDPDSREGVWLRRYLENLGVPYFAFRAALAGRSSAPHIHIGPPSPRVKRTD
jgi:hypothetical protein